MAVAAWDGGRIGRSWRRDTLSVRELAIVTFIFVGVALLSALFFSGEDSAPYIAAAASWLSRARI